MAPHFQDDRTTDTASPAAPRSSQPFSAARCAQRLLMLVFTLLQISARFALLRLRRGSRISFHDRAEWLHLSCCTVLRRLAVRQDCRGPRPTHGLVCANHLSYLDVAVCAAATPCVFVSKREVNSWPAFGLFARCAGTIFLDRESRTNADAAAAAMAEAMDSGVPVLLFPEGTSTDGSEVLRFHPTLLEPAIQKKLEIAPAAIAYHVRGGQERDACYYGDISFVRHLLHTLGRTGIVADIEFYPDPAVYAERHAAAQDRHDKLEAMRRRMMRDAD